MIFKSLTIIVVTFSFAWSNDWTQWRGSSRDGVVVRENPFPGSLKEPVLEEKWKVDLAEGYSSPVVLGEKVFTIETANKKHEVSRAFDLATGSQLWEKKWEGSLKVPFFAAKHGSWVRATPAVDQNAVYFCGMRDVLVKLNAETGDEIWRIDFMKREESPLPSFGYISSPLVEDGFLYVQAGSAVAKIKAETGENVWRALEDKRAMFGNAFSSPVLATIQGVRQLVVQNRMSLAGLDIGTGDVLWQTPVKAFRGMNILTPTVMGNRIFTASYGGGAMGFEIEESQGESKVKTLWNDEKLEGYMSSPLLIDGHIYLHGRDKKFHCLVMETGERKWTSDEVFGDYWSMIRKDNRVLSLDSSGEMLLFDASPEKFEILDRKKISNQSTWAHIASSGDSLVVRGLKELRVFSWKE